VCVCVGGGGVKCARKHTTQSLSSNQGGMLVNQPKQLPTTGRRDPASSTVTATPEYSEIDTSPPPPLSPPSVLLPLRTPLPFPSTFVEARLTAPLELHPCPIRPAEPFVFQQKRTLRKVQGQSERHHRRKQRCRRQRNVYTMENHTLPKIGTDERGRKNLLRRQKGTSCHLPVQCSHVLPHPDCLTSNDGNAARKMLARQTAWAKGGQFGGMDGRKSNGDTDLAFPLLARQQFRPTLLLRAEWKALPASRSASPLSPCRTCQQDQQRHAR
jgi:hypothetical protein